MKNFLVAGALLLVCEGRWDVPVYCYRTAQEQVVNGLAEIPITKPPPRLVETDLVGATNSDVKYLQELRKHINLIRPEK